MTVHEQLEQLLGLDPTKKPSPSQEAIKKAITRIQDSRRLEAEEIAQKILEEAIGLAVDFQKVEKEYLQQKAKYEKTLGKILNQVNGVLSGVAQSQEETSEEEKTQEEIKN